MSTGTSVLTVTQTRERAEWAADSLRRHVAFRGGEIFVEGPYQNAGPAHVEGDDERFHVLYRGAIRHEGVSCGVEPLDLEADDFEDRAAADRACAAARRDIPEGDISDVHVEGAGDAGPWYLVWLHACVTLRGHAEPSRPGS